MAEYRITVDPTVHFGQPCRAGRIRKAILGGVLAASLMVAAGLSAEEPMATGIPTSTPTPYTLYLPLILKKSTPTPMPTPTPVPEAPLQFFFDKPVTVEFDQLQFLDADGEVIETMGPIMCRGDRCGLNIKLPPNAHFLRVIATQHPFEPNMEWNELVENSVRMGVRVNRDGTPIITDDGFGPHGETDLTKHIASRPWISYFVLNPEADSEGDGIPNCTKIDEGHYRALDPNPRISEPKPIESEYDVVAYYVTFWGRVQGARTSDWSLGSKFTPLIGFYRSDDPDTVDKHIEQAVEHGVGAFIIWYSNPGDRPHEEWTKSFEDGFLRAKYLPYIRFAISYNWGAIYEDPYGLNRSFEELLDHTKSSMRYLCENVFSYPSYFELNDKFLIILQSADYWSYPEMGLEGFNRFIEILRETCRESGYDIYLVGDVGGVEIGQDPRTLKQARNVILLLDATTPVIILNGGPPPEIKPYDAMVTTYTEINRWWYEQAKRYGRGYIPSVCPGFDNIAMYESGVDDWLVRRPGSTPKKFEMMCKGVKPYIDPNPNVITVNAWNEHGEGNAIEPTLEFGSGYLEVLRKVF